MPWCRGARTCMGMKLAMSAFRPLPSVVPHASRRSGLGGAGYWVTSMSPGLHRLSAPSRLGSALLLYLRSPSTPPPRASHHPGLRSAPNHRAFRAISRRAGAPRRTMPGDRRSWVNVLGGRRLGVVGCRVTVSKGGGPNPVASQRAGGEARGTWRSPGTPPPRALSEERQGVPMPAKGRKLKVTGSSTRGGSPAAQRQGSD